MRAAIRGPSTTTERSTSPRSMRGRPPRRRRAAMRSLTNASSGKRPCCHRSTSSGKSRSGRQSPYQELLTAPPWPKTSISGTSKVIVGSGTPTSTAVPARSRASNACRNVSGRPTASMTTSGPNPPVSSRSRATTSSLLASTVSVAPKPRAHSSLRGSRSTAMTWRAPANRAPGDGGVADAAAADDGDRVALDDRRGVDRRPPAGHHAAAEQAGGGRVGRAGRPWCTGPRRPASSRRRRRCRGPATGRCRRPASSSGWRCASRSTATAGPGGRPGTARTPPASSGPRSRPAPRRSRPRRRPPPRPRPRGRAGTGSRR